MEAVLITSTLLTQMTRMTLFLSQNDLNSVRHRPLYFRLTSFDILAPYGEGLLSPLARLGNASISDFPIRSLSRLAMAVHRGTQGPPLMYIRQELALMLLSQPFHQQS